MSDNKIIKARVFRLNPGVENTHHYDVFEVPIEKGMSVLDILIHIYENLDSSLAFPYSCRIGRCGGCTLMVNGKPALICTSLAPGDMTIEPLPLSEVARDLVTDSNIRKKKL